MKDKLLFFGKILLLLGTGTVLAVLILTVAYMLPVNSVNREKAYQTLAEEGLYPRAFMSKAPSDSSFFHEYLPDVLDSASDTVMLYTALDSEGEGNALVRAMNSYSEYMGEYSYYWHGYVSVLRPLFLMFTLEEVRILNGFCQLMLMFALAWMIEKRKGMRYTAILLTSYFLLMPSAVMMSFQYSWVFYIAYLGLFVYLCKQDYWEEKNNYVYFFIVLGMFTSYFDLLTYPLITWGIPGLWMLVLDKKAKSVFEWLKKVVCSGISWIAGYAFLWAMKWVLATLVLKRDVIGHAVEEIFLRTGTQAERSYNFIDRLDALYSNWRHYGYKIYVIVLVIWVVWWMYRALCRGGWSRNRKRYAYALIAASSFVWYVVLANHTLLHHFFTYRIYNIAITAFLVLMAESVAVVPNSEGIWKRRLHLTAASCVAVALSVPFALLTREEFMVHNGPAEFEEIEVAEGTVIETVFTPTYNIIKGFCLGVKFEGTEGEAVLTVWENEKPKAEYVISAALTREAGYYMGRIEDVFWNLKQGKAYPVTIEIRDTEEPVGVYVTSNGEMPLLEYEQLRIDGEVVPGQLLTGLHYWWRPASVARLMFMAGSWSFLMLLAVYTFTPFLKATKKEKGKEEDICTL